MRSCSGPWEAKRPSVGRKAEGAEVGGWEERIGDPRDTVRGSQSKPRAESRLTVGMSKLVQAYCQTFLSVFISSARAFAKNVVVNESKTQELNKNVPLLTKTMTNCSTSYANK